MNLLNSPAVQYGSLGLLVTVVGGVVGYLVHEVREKDKHIRELYKQQRDDGHETLKVLEKVTTLISDIAGKQDNFSAVIVSEFKQLHESLKNYVQRLEDKINDRSK